MVTFFNYLRDVFSETLISVIFLLWWAKISITKAWIFGTLCKIPNGVEKTFLRCMSWILLMKSY